VHGPSIAVGNVVEHGVDDVLADPLLATAAHPHDRRAPRELGGEPAIAILELVALDLDR
jgi:hypothetical protein